MTELFQAIGTPADDTRVIAGVFLSSGLLAVFGYLLRRRGVRIFYQPATISSIAWGLYGVYHGLEQKMGGAGMGDAFQMEFGWMGPVLLVLTVVGYGAPLASLVARRREIAEWLGRG